MGRAENVAEVRRKRVRVSKYMTMHPKQCVGALATTPVPCSCPMCGNPRKYFGQRTIQELSFAQTDNFD